MRKEHAHFDKDSKSLIITGNKSDPIWYCKAKYKLFADGIHQQEIWFMNGDTDDSPEWMLDGADEYELDCSYDEDEWFDGFYYSTSMKPERHHPLFAFTKCKGQDRQIIIRSITVKE